MACHDDGVAAPGGIDRIGGIHGAGIYFEGIVLPISRIHHVDHVHIIEADAKSRECAAQFDDTLERRVRTGRVLAGQSSTDDRVGLWAEGNHAEVSIGAALDAFATAHGFVQQSHAGGAVSYIEGGLALQIPGSHATWCC